MKILRNARDKYNLSSDLFSKRGNLKFEGDVHEVRKFVQTLNKKRDLINFPEMAVKTSEIYSLTLISEIKEYVINLYQDQLEDRQLSEEIYNHLTKKFDNEEINNTLQEIVKEFPPNPVYKRELEPHDYLNQKEGPVENSKALTEELIHLWLVNTNPVYSGHIELFDDEKIEKSTKYNEIITEIQDFMEELPKFKYTDENLLETLTGPEKKYPNSLRKQLEYIREKWNSFIGKWGYLILTALDLIKEEEKMRGMGPGKLRGLEFYGLDMENYTPDKEWMPKVIMIAKNTYVWLHQLSEKYGYDISRLDQIPNEELDQLAEWGFSALWLIGVWKRSPASKTIKKWCGNLEAEASAYSLYDYVISEDLGGHGSYENLRDRAWKRGIRLASDMVPNHTGIDSKWVREHPDWYISLPYPPFPSYSYSGADLCGDPNVGVYVEDKYFSRSDAAVTFKRVDFNSGETRYIYHGNDGTSMPWNDTAQLNFLKKEVREAVIQKIIDVAKLFPIIRFDAAMTLARKHFQRLWFPEPGSGGDIPSRAGQGMSKEEFLKHMPEEFWREVVERVRAEVPDTLLLAEAFWLLEGFFVRTLGMHRVYNSIFMNALRDEDNSLYRGSIKKALEFDRRMLKRFVNFMNNPDEEPAINQFGTGDKYFGVCLLLVTMPGLPMFGHGQIQGFSEKYGMEYRKAYKDEKTDWGLVHHHERTIFPIMQKRYLFANSDDFYLYDFWTGGNVNEDVFAYSNKVRNERGFVIYNNRYSSTAGYIKTSVGYNEEGNIKQKNIASALSIPSEGYSIYKDYMSGLEYLQRNKEIHNEGLYFELDGYKALCLMDWQIVQDNEFFHYAQLYEMLDGKGVPSIEDTLNEMIYEPILTPFRQMYNANIVENLYLEKSRLSSLDFDFKDVLNKFLMECQRYSSNTGDINALQSQILEKIKAVIKIHNLSSISKKCSQLSKDIQKELNANIMNWGAYYGWAIVHLVGKISEKDDHELVCRSWMDKWRVMNVIQWVLGEIKPEQDSSSSLNEAELTFIIKLMIVYQDLFKLENKEEVSQVYTYIRELFTDPEVQNYLGVNRYQGELWFNKERFLKLSNALFTIEIINLVAANNTQQMNQVAETYSKWRIMAEKAEYNVEKFFDLLK